MIDKQSTDLYPVFDLVRKEALLNKHGYMKTNMVIWKSSTINTQYFIYMKVWSASAFTSSTDLVGLIDVVCHFVEEHVQLLSCVIVYDVEQTIRDWGVDLWY